MYIDTHTHLTDEDYADPGAIVADFDRDGLEFAVTVGYDLPSSEAALALAKKYDRVYAAVGIHPHDAETFDDAAANRLLALSRDPKVVAFGEIGLDYHYDKSKSDLQKRVFEAQLALADEAGLPVIFHAREATQDFNEILKRNASRLRYSGVLHCYANGAELVKWYAGLGLCFGFGGSTTFKNARGLLDAVRAVPADRILTETDCPYLAPVPHRGETNFPKYVALAAQKCAELRETDLELFCAQVRENALRLFRRIPR